MYQIEAWGEILKIRGTSQPSGTGWRLVAANVVFLGLTSLLTDISAEMVSTVLPVYLVFYLQISPFTFGIVDGLYQGASGIVRVASGLMADRWHGYKQVATAGYALSAVCKLGLLAAGGTWAAVAAVVLLDRTGKGIRTAPRDALISLSSPRAGLGLAFGVHRSFDTLGAVIGPLVAFGLLSGLPNSFDAVFVTSFSVALLGLGVIVLFVENRRIVESDQIEQPRITLPGALRLLQAGSFRAVIVAGTILSLITASDSFIYLLLQRRGELDPRFIPLMYTATAGVYFVLAIPLGRVADRLGRGWVFVGGYAALLAVYVTLLVSGAGVIALVAAVALLGAYYAATDGVIAALASGVLPAATRATGLGLLSTATSLGRLFASILFGALWTWRGADAAVFVFAVGLVFMGFLALTTLRRADVAVNG